MRILTSHEAILVFGGAKASECGCRRCREMSQLADDVVDFFKGIIDGIDDGL